MVFKFCPQRKLDDGSERRATFNHIGDINEMVNMVNSPPLKINNMKDKYTPIVNLLIAMKQKDIINAESMSKCIDDIRHALGKEQEIIDEARADSAESILKGEHWDENWYFNRFQNPVII